MPERSFTESELKEAVRKVLGEILQEAGLFSQMTSGHRYVPTVQAYSELGYQSAGQLYDAISDGLLRVGVEVQDRRKKWAKLPRYYFDIPACQKRLKELPEKRK